MELISNLPMVYNAKEKSEKFQSIYTRLRDMVDLPISNDAMQSSAWKKDDSSGIMANSLFRFVMYAIPEEKELNLEREQM